MDFEAAEIKLKKEQDRLRSRAQNRNASRTLASSDAVIKAKKAEEYRKRQVEQKKRREIKETKQRSYIVRGVQQIENKLGLVRQLGGSENPVVSLHSTSVHGLGDKITLPPSILSTLTERDLLTVSQERGQPLFFRLGIRRPNYSFPQSRKLLDLMEEYGKTLDDEVVHGNNDEELEHDDEMSVDDVTNRRWMEAYLEELSCEYISYTYATVVEFSQDEGYIGLPYSVANALLQAKGQDSIDSHLTVDPSRLSSSDFMDPNDLDLNSKSEQIKESYPSQTQYADGDTLEEKTPGHVAYGLFPVPVSAIEINLLTHLPFGKKCTLQPTLDAIHQGFYELKNVKLVLEQSLIRTRGSLNVGDVMHCWFRGKRFDLTVENVSPPDVGAISCVNCDIEVDIAPPPVQNHSRVDDSDHEDSKLSRTLSGGYKLIDATSSGTDVKTLSNINFENREINLPPEPPQDQEEGVIVIQIRGMGKAARRRFNESCTMKNLFDFAISAQITGSNNVPFKLVTRYPRRTFKVGSSDEDIVIGALGLAKHELFMVEI
jgi:hypothetical protein